MAEYKYDEGSETWPYFVLTMLVFVLVPLSGTWLAGVFAEPALERPTGTITEKVDVPHEQHLRRFRRAQRSRVFNRLLLLLVAGWAAVFLIWRAYAREVSLQGLFDPYTILDVGYSASEREVKLRYRQLLIKMHPDKIGKNLLAAEREKLEAAFIRVNQAYKALTDPKTMENMRLYGHPDGVQETTHGIAIPKFLVEGKYSPAMLVVYFLLIGVLLPLVVGSWWNRVKSRTRRGLHVETAQNFARKLADKSPTRVFTALDVLHWVAELQEVRSLGHTPEAATALVLRYLDRDFGADQLAVVARVPDLIAGFVSIATVFRAPDVISAAYDLQKGIVQAVRPFGKRLELLQLPHAQPAASPVKRLGKLVTLDDAEALAALGIADPQKVALAVRIAQQIPFLRIVDALFRVAGEEIVPPNSQAHLAIYFLVKFPRLKSCPDLPDERFAEEDTLEELKDPTRLNAAQPPLPPAFAPYFPKEVPLRWDVFVVNQSDNKLVDGASVVSLEHASLANVQLTQEEWLDPEKVTLLSFKMKLTVPAPPNVGRYHFRVLMKNNAYFGTDVDIPVEMEVESPKVDIAAVKRATEDQDLDLDLDISDPEEDTLAGALAALRGGAVKKVEHDDEEVEEEEFTDINTDTEDEG